MYGGCPGSSPRARGTVVSKSSKAPPVRFIPACAGNRAVAFWPTISPSVHPRVRGEQSRTRDRFSGAAGSSPRARGTGHRHHVLERERRFIPACAGNRDTVMALIHWPPVHPRVRGEQARGLLAGRCSVGSSPRARGTDRCYVNPTQQQRFIPACAGNSHESTPTLRSGTVHPRVRGEQWRLMTVDPAMPGSSPRARGTDPQRLARLPEVRFIPACAGNSGTCSAPAHLHPVHPRVRGEQVNKAEWQRVLSGSSPRARGTG